MKAQHEFNHKILEVMDCKFYTIVSILKFLTLGRVVIVEDRDSFHISLHF
jgi:hypothetical protein